MPLSVGTSPSSNLSVGTNTGMQGSAAVTPGASNLQGSPNIIQLTTNPQQTVDGGALNQGAYNIGGAAAGGVTPPYVDPWASTPWGSQAAHDKAVGDFTSARDTTYGSIGDAENNAADQYHSSILDYLDSYAKGQTAIDRAGVQNEMGREQGRRGVLDMVGTGIRSSGVTLANRNAGSSSATEAFARAYGELGRREMSKVGNQYAIGQNNIKGQADDLAAGLGTFRRHMGEGKNTTVNSIVQDATTKLAQLNAVAQNASLPDRIQIEQEKARIRNDAMAKLTAHDSALDNGLKDHQAHSAEQNHAEGVNLLNAGTAPESGFQFNTSAPLQFQNTGPFASSLPLFLAPKKADERNPVGV